MSDHMGVTPLVDGREVCTAFGVPVAAYIPERNRYVAREDLATMTYTMKRTAKRFAGLSPLEAVTVDEFRRLVAPIEVR